MNKKVKTFHANMLQKCIERADQDGAPQQNSDDDQIMSYDVCTGIVGGNEDLSVNNDEMMELVIVIKRKQYRTSSFGSN